MPGLLKEVVAVLSMVRSNLYRLCHGSLFWGYVVVYACVMVLVAAMFWSFSSYGPWGYFMDGFMGEVDLSSFDLYGQTFMSGGFMAILVAVLCEVFFVRDFTSGFMKNLLQIRGGRASYVAAASLTCLGVTAFFALLGAVLTEMLFRVFGFGPYLVFSGVGEVALLLFQYTLVTMAYVQIVLFVVVAFRSNALGVAVVCFVVSGICENLLQLALAFFCKDVPALRDCLDGYLAPTLSALANGPLAGSHVYVVAGATIAVAFAASLVAMVRKDVK